MKTSMTPKERIGAFLAGKPDRPRPVRAAHPEPRGARHRRQVRQHATDGARHGPGARRRLPPLRPGPHHHLLRHGHPRRGHGHGALLTRRTTCRGSRRPAVAEAGGRRQACAASTPDEPAGCPSTLRPSATASDEVGDEVFVVVLLLGALFDGGGAARHGDPRARPLQEPGARARASRQERRARARTSPRPSSRRAASRCSWTPWRPARSSAARRSRSSRCPALVRVLAKIASLGHAADPAHLRPDLEHHRPDGDVRRRRCSASTRSTSLEAKAKVGDNVCLMGNVRPAETLLGGTPETVRAEARKCLRTAATARAGSSSPPAARCPSRPRPRTSTPHRGRPRERR